MVAVCVSLVLIMFFVVMPLSYLFNEIDKPKNKDPYSLGCGLYLAFIVFMVIMGVATKRGANDTFVLKWLFISLACIYGILLCRQTK